MGPHEVNSATPKVTLWCLHGAVGMAADWRAFSQAMSSEGIAVRAVDLWRFLDCCPQTLSQVAAALNAEVRASHSVNVLVGYSMGGRIALHSLLEKSHPWQAAVIISAHPGLATEELRRERRKKDTEWSVSCLRDDWQLFLAKWQSQDVLQATDDVRPLWGDRGLLHQRRREIARSFIDWSLAAQQDLRGDLAAIRCPVLWLSGDHDPKFTALAAACVAVMPQAQHQCIEHAGHRLPWEQADAFTVAVTSFLKMYLP